MPFLVRHHPDPAGKARMPRPPGLPAGCVDLEPIANANPDLPWLDGRPDGPTLDPFLAETGLGALMTPTPFDARVLVQTRGGLHETGTLATLRDGLGFLGTAYPSRSTPLPLDGRRARRLEVLHATAFRGTPGDVVGEVVVGVRGSPPIRVPLVFGRNTGWWRAEAASNADAAAWTARRGVDVLTLYRLVVDLPPSASEPESFALAADPRSLASPFVVGLTSI